LGYLSNGLIATDIWQQLKPETVEDSFAGPACNILEAHSLPRTAYMTAGHADKVAPGKRWR
jgi:hypothetical protein